MHMSESINLLTQTTGKTRTTTPAQHTNLKHATDSGGPGRLIWVNFCVDQPLTNPFRYYIYFLVLPLLSALSIYNYYHEHDFPRYHKRRSKKTMLRH